MEIWGSILWVVVIAAVIAAALLCLMLPHEVLIREASLAHRLLLPAHWAAPAVRMLLQCLAMLLLFLGVGCAVSMASQHLTAPLAASPRWLPLLLLTVLTASQLITAATLFPVLTAALRIGCIALAAWTALILPRRRKPQ